MKAQTKALMASAVVIVLALSAVTGVTYSWFSDTETSDITINSAKIDIDGEYTDVTVGGGDGKDTKATLSSDKKDIIITNLVSNRTITANYNLTNSSTVNVLYRMYVVVDGVSDRDAEKMVSITGGPGDYIGQLVFEDGVAYVGGSSGTVLDAPVGDADVYNFTLTIASGDLTPSDFKIKIVNEAYQSDYTYSKVKIISSTGEASLPTGAVTDSVSFIGTAPAESGASTANAADTEVTFTADALNTVTDNGTKDVTLKTEMLDPVDGVAKIRLKLEGAATTDFGTEKVTVSLSIPGKYTGLEVKYNGSGAQPTDVKCVYDSVKNVTNVTFSTTHFSEFEVVAGANSTAEVTDADSLITAFSSGIKTVILVDDIKLDRTAFVTSTCVLNLNGHKIFNTSDIWEDESNEWSLISVGSNGDLTINGDGTLQAKKNDCYAVDIQDGGKCTINGGKYIGNIHAVYVLEGSLLITDGEYSVQQKYPEVGKEDEFVINLYDANRTNGTATATIMGGTYHNFDPSDCWAEGKDTNFLAEGYVSVKSIVGEDTIYNVVPAVAKIGEKYFSSLSQAIEAATDGDIIELLDGADVTLDNDVANTGDKSRNVTIQGNGTQTVDVITKAVAAEGGTLNYQRGSTFTFKNVNIVAGEGSFDGIVCDELSFEKCTITGKLTLYGKATFTNCTFENTMTDQYSIWTWGGTDVTFNGCTFNTNGKAILLYGQATAAKPTNLVVKDCVFNDRNNGSAEKAAIEIGNDYNATYTLTIDDITVNGFAAGKNTDSKIWANKNSMDAEHLSVMIDGTKIL